MNHKVPESWLVKLDRLRLRSVNAEGTRSCRKEVGASSLATILTSMNDVYFSSSSVALSVLKSRNHTNNTTNNNTNDNILILTIIKIIRIMKKIQTQTNRQTDYERNDDTNVI